MSFDLFSVYLFIFFVLLVILYRMYTPSLHQVKITYFYIENTKDWVGAVQEGSTVIKKISITLKLGKG